MAEELGCVRMFLGILVGASLEVCFPHSNGVDDSQAKTKLKFPYNSLMVVNWFVGLAGCRRPVGVLFVTICHGRIRISDKIPPSFMLDLGLPRNA